MKIVSLQSVGLGTFYVERTIDEAVYVPYYIGVGAMVDDLRGGYEGVIGGDKITVTKIEFGDMYHGIELPKQEGTYFVHTSDGHIRVLPADKYIAEWSE
ncbi:hypothetical protein [Leuconostoc mesenteroides]|jgi:hypothetical protein|uniref:hypothetical protein n=2 Tax=Leuconostoc mesenteroides TaxID=1245 RepID=UPI0023614E93|nr:hypothetical protein [Leuconostoc mesenteroides]MCH3951993.1 hypothetical protein [Leuconostoc mesenteroides]